MHNALRSILIVDDDAAVRDSLSNALDDATTQIRTAPDADAALAALSGEVPDVVIADVRMPGTDGIELLRLLRARAPEIDVVLMTAYDDLPTVAAAMRDGAADFLVKPLDLAKLRGVLERIFRDRAARAVDARTRDQTDAAREPEQVELIGHDPRMIEVFKLLGQVAASREYVLIRGESGTGKELVARAIHSLSPDRAEPFVAMSCTAVPTTLLESELFGHVKGAFTGAVSDRKGRFALAGRGTIFLDEIGDTAPDFQTKLLRVLQEREFYPVGAEQPERTQARVIAATHSDLEALVAAGRFREDLYYRLRVVEVKLPPLRERMGDLPLLAGHLIQRAASRLQRAPPVLSKAALRALAAHSWPGNVRELENCLTRAVLLAVGDVIQPEHLAFEGAAHEPETPQLRSLADVERDHVARVLAATGGHKAKAAEILQVSRPRLNRLLHKYGLE